MALLETSSYCERHMWIGKPDQSCPKCKAEDTLEFDLWQGMTLEERIEHLRKHILGDKY